MARFSLSKDQRQGLDSLIDAWEDSIARGQKPDPREFCAKSPGLAGIFLEEIAILKRTEWINMSTVGQQVPPQPFAPGDEIVQGYFLEKILGSGGFGTVWRAIGPGGVPVAIKCVWMGTERSRSEWHGLTLLKKLRHPHLLGLFGYWVKDGWLVVGGELAEGTLADAHEKLIRQGTAGFKPECLMAYFRDAADGLDYLHGLPQPLVHGDVKPANLLLVGGRCKVGDFGLVRMAANPPALLGDGVTLRFAAPESILGRTVPASDQYSLAVTYCHLRGVETFSDQGFRLAQAHLDAPPNLTGLTKAESFVMAKALAKDPSQRFQNCRELVDSLNDAIFQDHLRVVKKTKSSYPWKRLAFACMFVVGTTTFGLFWQDSKAGKSIGKLTQAAGTTEHYLSGDAQEANPFFPLGSIPTFANPNWIEIEAGQHFDFQFKLMGKEATGFFLSEMVWVGPDGAETRSLGKMLPEGIGFTTASGKLSGSLPPGLLRGLATATTENGEKFGQRFTLGAR